MLSTKLLLTQIVDRLDDLRMDDAISKPLYEKKSSKAVMLAALVEADRAICAEEKIVTEVAVFLKAGSVLVCIDPKRYPFYENIESIIQSKAAEITPEQLSSLLTNKAPLDIVEIKSSRIRVYDRYPIDSTGNLCEISFVGHDVHHNAQGAWFDRQAKNLWLNTPFESDVFLVFEAQIMPHEISMETIQDIITDDIDRYKIRTPEYCKSLLVHKILVELLPAKVVAQEGIAAGEMKARRDATDRRPGSGPRAYIPEGSYGFN